MRVGTIYNQLPRTIAKGKRPPVKEIKSFPNVDNIKKFVLIKLTTMIDKPFKCGYCGTAYATEEEKWCCPCMDDMPDYEDVESRVYNDRKHKRIPNKHYHEKD